MSAAAASAAAADGTWQKNVLCKYYVNGMCSRGQECAWSHDRSLANKKTLPCKYYSAGTCAYGDSCRFSHGQQFPPLNPFAPEFKTNGDALTGSNPPASLLSTAAATAMPLTPTKAASTSLATAGAAAKLSTSSMKLVATSGVKKSWADAPEFVPKSSSANRTWAQVVDPETTSELPIADAESQLCPFSMVGVCRYGEHCNYVHGMQCDMCGSNALHPFHQRQREQHLKMCLEQHEAAMELAFSAQRSKDKTCGICMEVVIEKKPTSEARFAIMPNCNHCYCLPCLRKWRQAKQFEHKIVRACPECRVTSDYICPSKYWIDTKEEKDKLLTNYKSELQKKQCKYFDQGKGECPFGNKCFYRHQDTHGKSVDIGPPNLQKRRVIRSDGGGGGGEPDWDDAVAMQRVLLQDFLQLRLSNAAAGLPLEDVLDMLELFSDDSDDSDDW